jgi:hypothetical protein
LLDRRDGRRETGRLDISYLQALSADAAPALAKLPPALRRRGIAALADRLDSDDPWSFANLSRHRARTLLEGDAAPTPPTSPANSLLSHGQGGGHEVTGAGVVGAVFGAVPVDGSSPPMSSRNGG